MKRVAVIGGGASGAAAAITIARKSKDFTVTIYEKLHKPLKKLLATGNGRCNLTNMQCAPSDYFGAADFAKPALTAYPPTDTLSFFQSLGLLCRTEAQGRVYPYAGQASAVRDALCAGLREAGVEIETESPVTSIVRRKNGFLLNNATVCDFVLLCAGGSAAPKHGTTGDSYRLLQQLGHTVISPTPALTALCCAKFPASLKGVRHICAVQLLCREKLCYTVTGEVQFTDYGLSGIPIMQLSRLVSAAPKDRFTVVLNCFPDLPRTQVEQFLRLSAAAGEKTAGLLLGGLLPQALANHLLQTCGIPKDTLCRAISDAQLRALARICTEFSVRVTQARDFAFAQVTAGGADCREFNPHTMESRLVPQFYACGEALDVDGGCGGYNLQWAWSSGRCAGDALVKEYGR